MYSSFGLLTDEYDPATGTASGVDLEYGFTARFTDSLTGMTHHQFRWYDAQLGKWISEDPLGFAAGDINTTRYVANAPLTYTDPTGLIAVNIAGGNGDAGHAAEKEGHHWVALGPVNQAIRKKSLMRQKQNIFLGVTAERPIRNAGRILRTTTLFSN